MKEKIKVIGIISSMNKHGNTATLVREILRGTQQNGAEIEEIFLPEKNIEFCHGCQRCMGESRCYIQDDFEEVRARIMAADGIVISSPTYAAAPSAILKNLIDRLGLFEYATSAVFGGKYVISVSTAASFGANNVAGYLAGLAGGSLMSKGYVTGKLAVHIKNKTVKEMPEVMGKALLLGKKITNDIKEGKTYPLQNFSTRLILDKIVKPNFLKIISKNKDGKLRGVYNYLFAHNMI